MRAYISPAKWLLSRVTPNHDGIRSFLYRRRAHVYIMTATLLLLTTVGFLSVRAIDATQPEQQKDTAATNEVKAEGTNVTTTHQSSDTGTDASQPTGSSQSSSGARTNVTVNNQNIPVPENGTVSKTIQNENGTTKVEISSSNTSTGDTNSSSTTSTHLNVSSHTSSDSVEISNSTE